jgi:DNA-binding FadR family transcriptional regulator
MSHERLRASIDQMEAWVADPSWEPDPEALARWDADFQTALAHAAKGPDWPDLMAG